MKKRLIFSKKILFVFLSISGLFFYEQFKLASAFANSSQVINSLRESDSHRMTTCGGFNSAHTTKKVVALTFDDGPSKKYTEQVTKVLELNGIRGTFFFIGRNVGEYPQIAREAYKKGHIIGNHTYSHYHLNRLTGESIEYELTKSAEEIKKAIGVYPLLFRPPYGACSAGSVRVARNLGYKTIMWNAMVDDYHVDRTTPEKIASKLLNLVRPGGIIGMHDGGGNREKTVAALQMLISILKNEGYEFVTIPELLGVQAYLAEPVPEPIQETKIPCVK